MRIVFGSNYLHQLERFVKNNRKNAEKVKKANKLFKDDLNHPSLNLEKLKGSKVWTIRIDRGNRIFFSWINESTHDLTVGVSSLDRTSSDSAKPTTSQSGFYRDKTTALFLDTGKHDKYRKY